MSSISDAFINLWDALLDAEDGVDEIGWNALLELGNLVDPKFVQEVKRFVGCHNGRFKICAGNPID